MSAYAPVMCNHCNHTVIWGKKWINGAKIRGFIFFHASARAMAHPRISAKGSKAKHWDFTAMKALSQVFARRKDTLSLI